MEYSIKSINDHRHVAEYGKKRHKAFTNTSLICLWPALHRSPLVWVALLVNISTAVLSVYASSYLDNTSSTHDFAILILFVSTFSWLAMYFSGSLIEWIRLVEENNVRKLLTHSNINKKASLPNIDLPIAIDTVGFYISAPAQLATIAIYSGYVFYRSPETLFHLLCCLLLFIYPIYKFSNWRRKMIRTVRYHRNKLVDLYDSNTSNEYTAVIDAYAYSGMHYFWRNEQALYLLKFIVFLFLLAALKYSVPTEHSFSILVALTLLVSSGHAFFNSICEFQEDKVALDRVREILMKITPNLK